MSETDPAIDLAPPAPISPNSVCGPDLDAQGDDAFQGFEATVSNFLPADYYRWLRPPAGQRVELAPWLAAADALKARTHDLRVLALDAKLALLAQDVARFVDDVGAIAGLLRAHWQETHPQSGDDDFVLRQSQLASLADLATVLLPLEYAPLLETSRLGAVSFRAWRVSTGAVAARVETRFDARGQAETDEEKFLPGAAIERLLRDIDMAELQAAHLRLSKLAAAVAAIETLTQAHWGRDHAVALDPLRTLVNDMHKFIYEALSRRDPTLAPVIEGATPEVRAEAADAGPSPQSLAEVDAALSAALGYFKEREPSSPALWLVAQARETLGKNLYEIVKMLAPAQADAARVFVGPESSFTVTLKTMAAEPSPPLERVEAPPAPSRAAALAAIDAAAAYLRRVEPSSPAPFLLERARSLASRDFVSLLHDVLPDKLLAVLKKGE